MSDPDAPQTVGAPSFAQRARRRLRLCIYGLFRLLAPETLRDVRFLRSLRVESGATGPVAVLAAARGLAEPDANELEARVLQLGARVAELQHDLDDAMRLVRNSGTTGSELTRFWGREAVYSNSDENSPGRKFHVADAPQNGVSLFAAKTLPFMTRSRIRTYGRGPIAALALPPYVEAGRPAASEIFVLGNSHDHLAVLDEYVLGAPQRHRSGVRTALYLHDLSLKYLLDGYFGEARSQELHREVYGSGVDRLYDSSARLLHGMSGVRLLCDLAIADVVFCHGERAGEMITGELVDLPYAPRVLTLAHPYLYPGHARAPREDCCPDRQRVQGLLRRTDDGATFIGCFGIPYAWKSPHVAYDVAESLVADGSVDGVVFAGYDAERLLLTQGVPVGDFAAVFSHLCDGCLMDVMSAVAVALQLRTILGGEASGVLAQLLHLGTPVAATKTLGHETYPGVTWLPMVAGRDEIRAGLLEAISKSADAVDAQILLDGYVSQLETGLSTALEGAVA